MRTVATKLLAENSSRLQSETLNAIDKLDRNCVYMRSVKLGIVESEPLLVAMDGLLRYAKAYEKRFEGKLADDYVLGDYWADAIKGLHGLLNGDGAVAMEKGITTDSKSNGVIEEVYHAALKAAGFNDQCERD